MQKAYVMFCSFLVVMGLPINSTALIIDLDWSRTANYSVDATHGASGKSYDDPYWSWVSGDIDVWDLGNPTNPFAGWNSYGTYTHTWVAAA